MMLKLIDPAILGDTREIQKKADQLADDIRSARKASGESRIFIAGEKEFEREAYNREHGVLIRVPVI